MIIYNYKIILFKQDPSLIRTFCLQCQFRLYSCLFCFLIILDKKQILENNQSLS